MHVLVTGGAGYIGSVVSAELLKGGHRVIVYDNLDRGHRQAVPAAAEVVVGDLSDRDALSRVFATARVDVVMHFAALAEVGESMQVPALYFRNNVANTLNLLEAMLAHEVRRFVFSSSAAVYGNPQRTPIEEGDALQPTNPYGESKLMVERLLDWFHRLHGVRFASLRYFNAAGAIDGRGEDHHPESHLIPRLLRVALDKNQEFSIHGTDYPTADGTCVRDYIHVADLAAAHLLSLDALERHDRLIYNLGNGHGFSVLEVVKAAQRVTGRSIPVIEGPRRPGDPAVLVASSEKIRRELNWQPKSSDLETILGSAWDWHRQHPAGYQ